MPISVSVFVDPPLLCCSEKRNQTIADDRVCSVRMRLLLKTADAELPRLHDQFFVAYRHTLNEK